MRGIYFVFFIKQCFMHLSLSNKIFKKKVHFKYLAFKDRLRLILLRVILKHILGLICSL